MSQVTKLNTLSVMLPDGDDGSRLILADALITAKGDWPTARASLRGKLPNDVFPKLDFAHAVAETAGDQDLPELADLRAFALKYNPAALAELMPKPADGADPRPAAARALRRQL